MNLETQLAELSLQPTPSNLRLPNELWQQIFNELRLQPLEYNRYSPDDCFLSNREALLALCLTSRLFLTMARPLLYETVILKVSAGTKFTHDDDDAADPGPICLLRTLMSRKDLRPLVKNLALPMEFSRHTWRSFLCSRRIALAWLRYSAFLSELGDEEENIFNSLEFRAQRPGDEPRRFCPDTVAIHLKRSERSYGKIRDETRFDITPYARVAKSILSALLHMTTHLETLLVQNSFRWLVSYGIEWNNPPQTKVAKPFRNRKFLPVLKTIQLQSAVTTPHGNDSRVYNSRGLSEPSRSEHLLGPWNLAVAFWHSMKSVKCLDIWSDASGHIDVEDIIDTITYFPTELEELRCGVLADLGLIYYIIGNATGLRTLSLDLWSTPNDARRREDDEEGRLDLNQVLIKRRSTLETLFLWTARCPPGLLAPHLGKLEKLMCLPKMQNLKYLSLEPHLLLDWTDANNWSQFFKLLPPNLVSLTLRFGPEREDDESRRWARWALGVLLLQDKETWEKKTPHLRSIHLDPRPYAPQDAQRIRDQLAIASIEFTWKDVGIVVKQ